MADDADKTDALSEMTHRANVYSSRRDEPPALATGECWFCGEPLDKGSPELSRRAQDRPGQPGRRWCDAGCRDDWQAENE